MGAINRLSIIFLLFFSNTCFGQINVKFIVRDSVSKETIVGAIISEAGKTNATTTDINGKASLTISKTGSVEITFTELGYVSKTLSITLPADSVNNILLSPGSHELEEVTISSVRTNSRIDDIPMRIEVLGGDDLLEENGVKPGNIVSLLGDIAGIQIQQVSASSGNTFARIQGLDGRYTQILKDGMPLFGGPSGSFSIMQIPPLDLKQIEIIKGSASTLYGGDAIGGIINLVSKNPSPETELTFTANQSSLLETNFNGYYSKRNKKNGISIFAQNTFQKEGDVDDDKLSDVPRVNSVIFHPRFIFYLKNESTLTINYNGVYDKRTGGEMSYFDNSLDTFYHIKNTINRNSGDVCWLNNFANKKNSLSVKLSGSLFSQDLNTKYYEFKPDQFIYYSEVSYVHKGLKADWVGGINFNGDDFKNKSVELSNIKDYSYRTIGAFLQSTWRPVDKLTIEAGLRDDNHSKFGSILLPRLSFLYKFNKEFTGRINGGYGYKVPTIVSYVNPETDLNIVNENPNLNEESSRSLNADINYNKLINEKLSLTINQSFFYTTLQDPVYDSSLNPDTIILINQNADIRTQGLQTYVRLKYDKFELYLGYVFTDVEKLFDKAQPYPTVTPRQNFAATTFYELNAKWKFGLEGQYLVGQVNQDYVPVKNYLMAALMTQFNLKHVSFVLNCENLLDFRQSKYEKIYDGTTSNPHYRDLWAPNDGRVINLSVKWTM